MANSYRPVLRDQAFLLPPDMREWLPPDHLVWFLLDTLDAVDTSAFDRCRRLGGAGAPGYDPRMLLGLLNRPESPGGLVSYATSGTGVTG